MISDAEHRRCERGDRERAERAGREQRGEVQQDARPGRVLDGAVDVGQRSWPDAAMQEHAGRSLIAVPAPWPRVTSWSANAAASIATVAPIIGHGRACLDRCRSSATAAADEPFIGGTAPDWNRATSPARSAVGRVPAAAGGSSRGARSRPERGPWPSSKPAVCPRPVSDTVWKRSGPRTPIDQASSGSLPDGRVATTSPVARPARGGAAHDPDRSGSRPR